MVNQVLHARRVAIEKKALSLAELFLEWAGELYFDSQQVDARSYPARRRSDRQVSVLGAPEKTS
jgi:hypothetical protein